MSVFHRPHTKKKEAVFPLPLFVKELIPSPSLVGTGVLAVFAHEAFSREENARPDSFKNLAGKAKESLVIQLVRFRLQGDDLWPFRLYKINQFQKTRGSPA